MLAGKPISAFGIEEDSQAAKQNVTRIQLQMRQTNTRGRGSGRAAVLRVWKARRVDNGLLLDKFHHFSPIRNPGTSTSRWHAPNGSVGDWPSISPAYR